MAGKPAYEEMRGKIKNLEKVAGECKRKLSTLMANLPGMTYLCHNDENWTMEYVSEGCHDLTGYDPVDLIGNRILSYNDLIHQDDQLQVWVQIQEAIAEKRLFQLVYRIRVASGEEKWVWEQGLGVFSKKGELLALAGFISDVINHALVEEAESRLAALIKLNEIGEPYVNEVTRFALEEALRLTHSPIGYLAFVNTDDSMVTMHAWAKIVGNQFQIYNKPSKYPLENIGSWREAVKERKPIIINDFSGAKLFEKEIQQPELVANRHMSIPVFDEDRVVAVVGVANKPVDYDHKDIEQLTLLMKGLWRLILFAILDEIQ